MSKYVRGDVTLLRTVDQLIFKNYIAHKKQRLLLVVCLFLNDTSFKILKGEKICKKCFRIFVFHVVSEKLYNLLHAVDCFSFLCEAKS